jgi:hypothetical protein
MPVNPWAAGHKLGEEAIGIMDSVPGTKKTECWSRPGVCRCCNYETEIGGRLVRSYCRQTLDERACESTLVFDVDKLRLGFSGPAIA